MPMIDFEAVKAAISLSQVLSMLGRLPRLYRKTQFKGFCPLGCDGHLSCSFNIAKNVWHCHRCKKGGNQLDLYMFVRRMSIHQAALDICNRAGIEPPLLTNPPPACLREPKESEWLNSEGIGEA